MLHRACHEIKVGAQVFPTCKLNANSYLYKMPGQFTQPQSTIPVRGLKALKISLSFKRLTPLYHKLTETN